MSSKKINFILVIVSLALIIVFIGCLIYSYFNPEFSFGNTISSISSFFVAILTVITVYTTSRQLDFMQQQLDQMRDEQRLSEQPVLDVVNPEFKIERPRFFYSPKEYIFQSRYFFSLQVNNLSSYPAIFTDISAELIVEQKNKEIVSNAASRRLNVIAANATSNIISIMFVHDTASNILSALRSSTASALPKLRLIITYKSLSGANYMLEHTYLLDIKEETDDQGAILKNWHTTIAAASIEEKETLEALKRAPTEEKQDELFALTKKIFDDKLIGGESLSVSTIEIPQKFVIKCVTDDEFNSIMDEHHYGKYIGNHLPECKLK